MDQLDPAWIEDLWQASAIDPTISVSDPVASIGQSIEMKLIERGLADEHKIAQAYGNHYLLPVFDPPSDAPPPIDPCVGQLLPKEFCREYKIAPLATEGDFLDVAVFTPESLLLSEKIQSLTGRHMRPMFAPLSVMNRLLATLYPEHESVPAIVCVLPPPTLLPIPPSLEDPSKRPRPNRYLSDLFNRAIRTGVSRIYFVKPLGRPRVRFRSQERLLQCDSPQTLALYEAMIGQIKRIAKMDADSDAVSASGRINLRRDGVCVDADVHCLSTREGEQLVIKLNQATIEPRELSELGFTDSQQSELVAALRRPRGMTLILGPAQSGRSTTQHACLEQLDSTDLIRCAIRTGNQDTWPGVIQLSSLADFGMGDWQCFDACLRHEPDVMLIESLDHPEMALRAAFAAASSQRIITSVRATTASEAIGQLRSFGLDDCLIANSLTSIVCQRRVRRLCEQCRQATSPCAREAHALGLAADQTIYQNVGCPHCQGSGYAGWCMLFEVLTVTEPMREAISLGLATSELASVIHRLSINTLQAAAVASLLAGNTSLDELRRFGLLKA